MIENKTKKMALARDFELCTSELAKARGLMFSRPKTLIFVFDKEKIVLIHMFFVFFPIDILFLNKDRRVVEIKKGLRPFEIYKAKNKAKFFIESPLGMLKHKSIEIGDKLKWA